MRPSTLARALSVFVNLASLAMIPWCLAVLTAVHNALPSTPVLFLDVARPEFHLLHKPFVCTPFYLFLFLLAYYYIFSH